MATSISCESRQSKERKLRYAADSKGYVGTRRHSDRDDRKLGCVGYFNVFKRFLLCPGNWTCCHWMVHENVRTNSICFSTSALFAWPTFGDFPGLAIRNDATIGFYYVSGFAIVFIYLNKVDRRSLIFWKKEQQNFSSVLLGILYYKHYYFYIIIIIIYIICCIIIFRLNCILES